MTPDDIMTWLGLDGPSTIIPVEVTLGMANVPVPQDDLDHIAVFRIYLGLAHPESHRETGNQRRL